METNDNKILSHSVWNCKYHIVFEPKYRRKIFYESHRKEIMNIIKDLCQWKGIEIIEGEMAVDHVHLLLSKPPKMSVSGVRGYLKGKSSLMIYQKFGTAKFQYRCREFCVSWILCRHDRQEYSGNQGIHTKPIKKR